MNVHCSTCEEPWDVFHLWYEVVFETNLSTAEAEEWCRLPPKAKLANRYRLEFEAAGWQFGQSVINIVRCPACPNDAKPNQDRVATKRALEKLLGNDENGLAAI